MDPISAMYVLEKPIFPVSPLIDDRATIWGVHKTLISQEKRNDITELDIKLTIRELEIKRETGESSDIIPINGQFYVFNLNIKTGHSWSSLTSLTEKISKNILEHGCHSLQHKEFMNYIMNRIYQDIRPNCGSLCVKFLQEALKFESFMSCVHIQFNVLISNLIEVSQFYDPQKKAISEAKKHFLNIWKFIFLSSTLECLIAYTNSLECINLQRDCLKRGKVIQVTSLQLWNDFQSMFYEKHSNSSIDNIVDNIKESYAMNKWVHAHQCEASSIIRGILLSEHILSFYGLKPAWIGAKIDIKKRELGFKIPEVPEYLSDLMFFSVHPTEEQRIFQFLLTYEEKTLRSNDLSAEYKAMQEIEWNSVDSSKFGYNAYIAAKYGWLESNEYCDFGPRTESHETFFLKNIEVAPPFVASLSMARMFKNRWSQVFYLIRKLFIQAVEEANIFYRTLRPLGRDVKRLERCYFYETSWKRFGPTVLSVVRMVDETSGKLPKTAMNTTLFTEKRDLLFIYDVGLLYDPHIHKVYCFNRLELSNAIYLTEMPDDEKNLHLKNIYYDAQQCCNSAHLDYLEQRNERR